MLKILIRLFFTFFLLLSGFAEGQVLMNMQDVVDTAVAHYGSIRAKQAYLQGANYTVTLEKRAYLPNVLLSAQHNYGTVNGQNGPLYAFPGQAIASSGLPLAAQNWNAAFGALYLANVNWEVFSFGRVRERVVLAERKVVRFDKDLQQEIFNHKVKVAAAYLNLVAAKRITASYQKNLERADTILTVVRAKALTGLIAGVDSTQAAAEVANAKIQWLQALDQEQQQESGLATLMGVEKVSFTPDTAFLKKIPAIPDRSEPTVSVNPVLQWYQSNINEAEQNIKYLKRTYYPSVILGAAYQTRGSGFSSNYAQDQTAYSKDFFEGINPQRTNYIFALGITWNVAQLFKITPGIREQQYTLRGLQEEYQQADLAIREQLALSDKKIANALQNQRETPVQLRAANQAYIQKRVRYENGLTDLVDLSQAMYVLIRAETQRDIANTNVWQAYLLKAAASGDFRSFLDLITDN